jgi:hypothetical protein
LTRIFPLVSNFFDVLTIKLSTQTLQTPDYSGPLCARDLPPLTRVEYLLRLSSSLIVIMPYIYHNSEPIVTPALASTAEQRQREHEGPVTVPARERCKMA